MGAVIFVVYFLLFSVLTIRHISYALVALICMFAFEQWGALNIPAIASNSILVNLSVLALVLLAALRLPITVALEFLGYPIRAAIIFLLLYALLSTTWAPLDANATGKFMVYFHYLLAYVAIAPLLLRKSEHITRVLNAVSILGGMLVILFAYVPNFEGRSIATEYDLDETVGLPLALGDFAGVVLLVVMIRAGGNLFNVLWALIVACSALFLITKTGSRGQLAFVLMALIICFPVRWKKLTVNRFMTMFLLVSLIFVAMAFVLTTENTLSSRIYSSDGHINTGADSRIRMISVLLTAWSSGDLLTLIFGLGSAASWSQNLTSFYPHVVPLEILGELGFFGFVIFMGVVCGLFFLAFSNRLKAKMSAVEVSDFAALFGCFVFALLISTKQGSFVYSTNLMLFAIIAEKCFWLSQDRDVRKKRRNHKRLRRKRNTERVA